MTETTTATAKTNAYEQQQQQNTYTNKKTTNLKSQVSMTWFGPPPSGKGLSPLSQTNLILRMFTPLDYLGVREKNKINTF